MNSAKLYLLYSSKYHTCDNQMEPVVFADSLKFFFAEGAEQFIVGIQTANKIGLKATVRMTIGGSSKCH